MHKVCILCETIKPKSAFGIRANSKDGLSSHCKECENLRYKKRYQENTDKEKSRKNTYYHQNKEVVSQQQSSYYQKNLEKVRSARSQYSQENPEKRRAWESERRARVANASGSFSSEDIAVLRVSQNNRCLYCEKPLSDYHVDHMVPLARGGSNGRENICLACPDCNLKKNVKTAEEFLTLIRS